MKTHPEIKGARCAVRAVSMAAVLSLGLAAPLLAAPVKSAVQVHGAAAPDAMAARSANKCMNDLGTFTSTMQKDGNWFGGSGYGYGSPMEGYHPEAMARGGDAANEPAVPRYMNARPGYEIHTLIASANILAQHGQQAQCEALLGTTRKLYGQYGPEMHHENGHNVSSDDWRRQQIADAQTVGASKVSYRSNELIGTDVLDAKGAELGSVHDIVLSPKEGKIAYLVIGRGGFFGINKKYVPVPWADFKATSGATLLVLDATKATMEGAPQVKENQFSAKGGFDQESQKVDEYWTAHRPT